jgi:uncharacterized surface protein with fasciclin (FAS1) repeats
MKRIYGKLEAMTLVLVGLATAWFAFSTHYGLLMNPKFKWLSVTGALLVLGMGAVASISGSKRNALNVFVFGLLLLIILVGQPYLPDANSAMMVEPALQAGLWAQVDQVRFPRMDLQELYLKGTSETFLDDQSFTTIGVVKRLDAFDEQRSFALMTTMMACCIADAFAVGFRVPYDQWETIEDGQWLMVSGKLVQPGTVINVPNFRFGRAMLSTVDKEFVIQPETIMAYDRVAQLPLLSAQLNTDNIELFNKALKQTGLWQTLQEDGPFTVFVPVDQAFQDLDEQLFADAQFELLKQWLSCHIVPGKLFTSDLVERDSLQAINGQALKVELENGKLRVGQSRLLFKNKEAKNGVIHFVYPAIVPDDFVSTR